MTKHAVLMTVTNKQKETLLRQMMEAEAPSALTAAARLIEEQIRADLDIELEEDETLIIALTPAEPPQQSDPGVCFAGSWMPEGDHSRCTHGVREDSDALDTSSDSTSAEESR